jgi:hypothetical protein
MSQTSFWASKTRQFKGHLRAKVRPQERAVLAAWTTPAQRRLFDTMHVADQRHGLDVVASLRADGIRDRDVLLAGLLHDAGKGDTGVWPRVAYSLGQRYGPTIPRVAGRWPGMDTTLARLRDHAESSARLAAGVGCSPRTVELIRYQDDPRDADGERLRLADEAN